MSSAEEKDFGTADANITRYAIETFHPEDAALQEIRIRAKKADLPPIHVGPMDALHLEVLTRMTGAKKVVEIGTLAGLSGLCFLRALPADGRLYTFEYEEKHAKVARETFSKSGFDERYEIFVGEAIKNLPQIEKHGPFDLVFIDADKASYPDYLDWAAKNLKIGGVVLGDNTFAWGEIWKTSFDNPRQALPVNALREFNSRLANDSRFRATILPTGEGLTVGVKVSN